MSGLWKDLPYKISKKVKENWLDTLFFLVPTIGTYQCAPAPRSWQSRRQPATCARSGEGSARLCANPSVLTCRCALYADALLACQVCAVLQGEGEAAPQILRELLAVREPPQLPRERLSCLRLVGWRRATDTHARNATSIARIQLESPTAVKAPLPATRQRPGSHTASVLHWTGTHQPPTSVTRPPYSAKQQEKCGARSRGAPARAEPGAPSSSLLARIGQPLATEGALLASLLLERSEVLGSKGPR